MQKHPINLAILACFGSLALSTPAMAETLDDLRAEIQAQKARLEKLEENAAGHRRHGCGRHQEG